jgi:hypothetical protein
MDVGTNYIKASTHLLRQTLDKNHDHWVLVKQERKVGFTALNKAREHDILQ